MGLCTLPGKRNQSGDESHSWSRRQHFEFRERSKKAADARRVDYIHPKPFTVDYLDETVDSKIATAFDVRVRFRMD